MTPIIDDPMALLVRSVMLSMKDTAPVMMAQKTGSTINMPQLPRISPGYSSSMIYGAAKVAILHLTRCAAMELGEHNVRVNSVSPGAISTGILAKALGLAPTADGAHDLRLLVEAGFLNSARRWCDNRNLTYVPEHSAL